MVILVVAVVVYAVEQFKSKTKRNIYMDEYTRIYPQVPLEDQSWSENFRLQQVSNYFSDLEKELDSRDKIFQKYKKLFKILIKVSASAGLFSVLLSGSGTGTALTGVGLPVGVSLASLAAILGLVSVSTGASLKKISQKVSKHEKIVSLCQDKLIAIRETVSKALEDGKISHEEFLSVKSEVEKYYEMKKSIQAKKKIAEGEYENLEEIKRQIQEEMKDKLNQLFSR